MEPLLAPARLIAERLRVRGETLVVAESSAGGLVSAALLSTPGASAFYLGGIVVYTRTSRTVLLGMTEEMLGDIRSATEPYAQLVADTARDRMAATWALAETGATGPAGNRYGDAAGHACFAVSGPVRRVRTLETGSADRAGNMMVFAEQALLTLLDCLPS